MKETKYNLQLTAEELAAVYVIIGSISGGGPVRELADKVYYAIDKQVSVSLHSSDTFQIIAKLCHSGEQQQSVIDKVVDSIKRNLGE